MADEPEKPSTSSQAPEPITRVDAGAPPPPEPTQEPQKKSTYTAVKEKVKSAYSSARSKASGVASTVKRFVSRERRDEKQTAYAPIGQQQKSRSTLDQRVTAAKNRELVRKAADKVIAKGKAVRAKLYEAGKYAGEHTRDSAVYKGAQLGYQESKAKFKVGLQEGAYSTGRAIGRAPTTLATYGVKKAREFQHNVGEASKKGWHAGLLQHPGAGRSTGSAWKPQTTFHPHATMGRQPRIKIGRGIIKTYWNKKLKKLARSNIRKFGVDEGMARTRQVAQISGWKMQERRQ